MKKVVSVCLAVLMALSVFCVIAYADDVDLTGYVQIPTSAEGLEAGAYYLDLEGYEYASMLSSTTLYFNEDEAKLITAEGTDYSVFLLSVLAQVGTTWVKAKLPGEAKAEGDYYLDIAESTWSVIADAGYKAVYINTAESSLIKGKVVLEDDSGERNIIEPIFDMINNSGPDAEESVFMTLVNSVKIYDGSADEGGTEEPGDPGNSGNSGSSVDIGAFFSNLWAKITAFFQKIVDFFKNLINK